MVTTDDLTNSEGGSYSFNGYYYTDADGVEGTETGGGSQTGEYLESGSDSSPYGDYTYGDGPSWDSTDQWTQGYGQNGLDTTGSWTLYDMGFDGTEWSPQDSNIYDGPGGPWWLYNGTAEGPLWAEDYHAGGNQFQISNLGDLSNLGGASLSPPATLPTTSYGALVGPDGQPVQLADGDSSDALGAAASAQQPSIPGWLSRATNASSQQQQALLSANQILQQAAIVSQLQSKISNYWSTYTSSSSFSPPPTSSTYDQQLAAAQGQLGKDIQNFYQQGFDQVKFNLDFWAGSDIEGHIAGTGLEAALQGAYNLQSFHASGDLSPTGDEAFLTVPLDGLLADVAEEEIAELTGTELARALGKDGEEAANIVKNTEHINSITNTAAYRIPDVLDQVNQIIGDVKNVAKLAFGAQLQGSLYYALEHGYDFILIVRKNTSLTTPLKLLEQAGFVTILRTL